MRVDLETFQNFVYYANNSPVGVVSIATAFQYTGIAAFQTKCEYVETNVRTSLVYDADNTEWNTYFFKSHSFGVCILFQYMPYGRGEGSYVACIRCDALKAFGG